MQGFFPSSTLVARQPLSLLPKCGSCKLFETCKSPKMKVDGRGKKKILVIGEAPGRDEDSEGKPFVGVSGRLLADTMTRYGVDLRRDCWITNALICRPPNNRTPTDAEVDYCRPNITRVLREYEPEKIILLGLPAVVSVLSQLWKEDELGTMTRWAGWRIPCQRPNAWLCPTWHPSFVLRAQKEKKRNTELMYFRQHIRRALELEGRPWDVVPDYASQIKCIYDDEEARRAIVGMIAFGSEKKPMAIDYETNMLKPDSDEHRIVSCSISDGKTTIAYPWRGQARKETGVFLRSPIPKIAANMGFEERWTIAEFGHGVNNWWRDIMLRAHVIDNRRHITSLKFQSFVMFGTEDYDHHIKQFLKGKNPNKPNNIKEIDLKDLLRYNGLDAFLEWMVAERQGVLR